MKRLLLVLLALVILTSMAYGQVNVTYKINASTVAGAGITDTTHQVQVCGSEVGPEGDDRWENNFLTWDDSSPLAQNIAGDYWELTIEYPDSMIGWRMAYKVRYKDNEAAEFTWEDYPPGNRMFVLPDTDTTLAMADSNKKGAAHYTETDRIRV